MFSRSCRFALDEIEQWGEARVWSQLYMGLPPIVRRNRCIFSRNPFQSLFLRVRHTRGKGERDGASGSGRANEEQRASGQCRAGFSLCFGQNLSSGVKPESFWIYMILPPVVQKSHQVMVFSTDDFLRNEFYKDMDYDGRIFGKNSHTFYSESSVGPVPESATHEGEGEDGTERRQRKCERRTSV